MENLEAGDPQRIGPYSLLGRLSTISTGKIFAGRSDDGRVVTVAVVGSETAAAPEFRERFRGAVAAARTISGAFILPIVDADSDASGAWVASAFLPGVPLRRAVQRYGALPESALRQLADGIAQALATIHAGGLTHGNLGPDSALLTEAGPYTAALDVAGVARNAGSPQDDMFDLGTTVLYAATGTEPTFEETAEDLPTRIAEIETTTSVLPPSLREVIGGCLYPDPGTRPTAGQLVDYLNRQEAPAAAGSWLPPELIADITAIAAATGATTATVSSPHPGPTGSGLTRRNLLLGLAGGAVLVGGVAAAAIASSSSSSPKPLGLGGGPTPPTPTPPTASTSTPDVSPTTAPTTTSSSADGPAKIPLAAPDAAKAWTVTGPTALTAIGASDKAVMVLTADATTLVDASTGKRMFPSLNTSHQFGSNEHRVIAYDAGVFYYLCEAPGTSWMLAALNGATGTVKWTISMAGVEPGGSPDGPVWIPTDVAVSGNAVYVTGSVDDRADWTTGYIRAFDGVAGKATWHVSGKDINNVLVPPTGSHLLVTSSTPDGKPGQVEMIDAGRQGARGWKTVVPDAKYYFTPGWPLTCYAAGLFVFGGGTGDTLFAVDAATGAEKWHQQFEAESGDHIELGAPFVSLDGATVYIGVGSDLAAFAAADGTLCWIANLTGVDPNGGATLFNASLRTSGHGSECSADTVFVTDSAKNLWAIDAATGKARWKYNDPGQPDIGFLWTVGGDHVFVASNLTLTAISIH